MLHQAHQQHQLLNLNRREWRKKSDEKKNESKSILSYNLCFMVKEIVVRVCINGCRQQDLHTTDMQRSEGSVVYSGCIQEEPDSRPITSVI